MSLELIASYEEKIGNAERSSDKTRYATELYSELTIKVIKGLDPKTMETAANLIGNYLSSYIADIMVENYKIWRKFVKVEEGKLDPSTIRGELNLGIEKNIFTSAEVMDAEISYKKKNGRDKETVYVHRP